MRFWIRRHARVTGLRGSGLQGLEFFAFEVQSLGGSRSVGFWGSGLPGVGLRGFKALGLELKG